jgi:hypothetical protein
VGWIALGLVIVFIYLTTKVVLLLERQRSKEQFEQIYLPEPFNVSRKTKILKEAPNNSALARIDGSWCPGAI